MRCECVEQHGTAQIDCMLCGGCGLQYAGEGQTTEGLMPLLPRGEYVWIPFSVLYRDGMRLERQQRVLDALLGPQAA